MNKTIYTPKALKGQFCEHYIKVNRRQVSKLFKSGQSFNGFIVGNKVASFHFFAGWHLAYSFDADNEEYFNKVVNSFRVYLDKELGSDVAIYISTID